MEGSCAGERGRVGCVMIVTKRRVIKTGPWHGRRCHVCVVTLWTASVTCGSSVNNDQLTMPVVDLMLRADM